MKTGPNHTRIILWSIVAVYTAALPYFILGFNMITRHFSARTAGNVPLFMIIFLAVVYALITMRMNKIGRGIGILSIGAIIVTGIMVFEKNPNKHIHIPEYILMTWLLYQAMFIDYRGRGILLLVLICASMLGVVDEVLQGIHPLRTYGWKDMIIDASSSMLGVLTIMGVKDRIKGDWSWVGYLKQYKAVMAVILFGMPTAVLMCVYLFRVQAAGSFNNVYPAWLLSAQMIIIIWTVAAVFFYWNRLTGSGKFTAGQNDSVVHYRNTAKLWLICPLLIIASLNLLVIWAAVAGIQFN